MEVVPGRGIFVGGVTLQADAVTRRTKSCGVRLVTIAASDAGREHPALLERAVVVDLVQHLPVGTVEPARERRDGMRVREPPPRHPILGELAAARVPQVSTSLRTRAGVELRRALPVFGSIDQT